MRFSLQISALLMIGGAFCMSPTDCHALGEPKRVFARPHPGSFALATSDRAASIYVDESDWVGVQRAAVSFAADIATVTGMEPTIVHTIGPETGDLVIIGTLGHSKLIDRLAAMHKIDVSAIRGRWETSVTLV